MTAQHEPTPDSRRLPWLLDLPAMDAARFAAVEDKAAAVLHTTGDVVTMQGEALLPLESCIRSAAGPGTTALNVITGPYGETFGTWLRSTGAHVVTLDVPSSRAVTPDEIAGALAEHPAIDFVSLVHAEAATGNTNPVDAIGPLVRAHGALLMVDAVASVGAEPVLTDEWGIDLCVIGGQKALAGPAGVSVTSVSERAWERIAANTRAPRGSYLSLLDWKSRWIEPGRTALPHAPAQLEMLALEQALDRIAAEGLPAAHARHAATARALRAGVRRLPGVGCYVVEDAHAAPAATTLTAPDSTDARTLTADLLAADPSLPLQTATGTDGPVLRVNHYGAAAGLPTVLDTLAALARATAPDAPDVLEAARAAAESAWEDAR
ncbi:pyridoxal-phosphate-dependent aminotransferase family protein [Streptomyces sp. NHF165]|uniref:pyridoxal-phosphate-dependent aminotransferase family protein n=1 Tax=Streptomyces sp. NHF165 TaxID=2175864 RepID=UPI003FCDD3FD